MVRLKRCIHNESVVTSHPNALNTFQLPGWHGAVWSWRHIANRRGTEERWVQFPAREFSGERVYECTLTIANVKPKSYLALLVEKQRHVLQMLAPHTRAMGRFFLDVVWCDLSVTFTMGRAHSYLNFPIIVRILRLININMQYVTHRRAP